ncbi:MJ0042-type zinc finger domain-containing protein [Bradyrhizobium sp. LHD-71]|uniref:MJ0042-type zinc finger domain-containing protein n=1 Tax=Bradyrhizobium sp. LHD-71 TaxID=3072141 RepID=UPI00280D58C8|nr:MJ0042-type zinc finger domain-containing protein [Bradyrhizobium sp. LHD-71]MDQ8730579.1 zinc-ribbon domain-containing protein [Bradyrhizobium sp. LHD-71]
MNIVCPNCGTSYDVEASTLGAAGRTVRCVRCRETWHARVQDLGRANALVHVDGDRAGAHEAAVASDLPPPSVDHLLPQIESPPLVHDGAPAPDWTGRHRGDANSAPSRPGQTRAGRLRQFAFGSGRARGLSFSPATTIAAMAALVLALIIWRNDVVRLLPQTAAFFQATGLGVNLRNLTFEDVKISTETVSGQRVYVIEGAIAATSRKAVEIPRLRFVVQDANGADIYAWNSVVDQAAIRPGEKIAFKSRLASPPTEAHSIIVRFFHKRDLATGSV